jgi:hypothetical protein
VFRDTNYDVAAMSPLEQAPYHFVRLGANSIRVAN